MHSLTLDKGARLAVRVFVLNLLVTALAGTAFGQANVSLTPTSVSFGTIVINTSSPIHVITVTNKGNAALNISHIATTGQSSMPSNTCSVPIAPGENCSIDVIFSPTQLGLKSGTLVVTDDAPSGSQSVPLTGFGTIVSLYPQSLNFAPQVVTATSAPQAVTLTNVGIHNLSITGITTGGTNAGDFATPENSCGSNVIAGGKCTINITFTPTAPGTRSAALQVADNGGSSPQKVPLTGTGASIVSVVVHPVLAPVTFGVQQQFIGTVTTTVTGSNGTALQWSVDGVQSGSSAVGTIDSNGVYTPPQSEGPHTVTATSVADPTKSGEAQAVVTNYSGVFTYKNDQTNSGQNLHEIVLTRSNVNSKTFGRVFSYAVDGAVFAQPLYVANVNIPNKGVHNVVYVATEHDTCYALDADGKMSAPLWQVSFIDPSNGITTVPTSDLSSHPIQEDPKEWGVTATPVIDPTTQTLYVHVRTKENGIYIQRLHALDIRTGQEMFGGPVQIQASVKGTGEGNDGRGNVPYDPLRQHVRSALVLANGQVYFGSASIGDIDPYHGWVLGYDATTLQLKAVINTSPNGAKAGIWQMGSGPGVDANGNLYYQTGNGVFDANKGGEDYGQSLIKLTPNTDGSLSVSDYFTPSNVVTLNKYDWDMASAGVLLLPDQNDCVSHPHLIVGGGKEGTLYLVDRDALSGFHSAGDQVVQEIVAAVTASTATQDNGLWATPALWQNNIYLFGKTDVPKIYQINGCLLSGPISQGSRKMNAPVPVISANGATNGIVWIVQWDAKIFRAYDATNVSVELYDSGQAGTRDEITEKVFRSSPTVANGRVYVGTSTELVVFGPLP